MRERIQYLIRFGYIGQYFHGLQWQPNIPTVAGTIAELIENAAQRRSSALQFAARTDKHVSALVTYATCWFKGPFDTELFEKRLKQSQHLGILAICARQVPKHIHARGSSRGKHYRYVIARNNPFAWHIEPVLDVETMKQAAAYLVGEHDFSSFRAKGCSANHAIKNISRIDITPISKQIHIDIYGDAFLRQMIRIIVGTLSEFGVGFRQPDEMPNILNARNRRASGPAAPAQGLTLMELYMHISDST